MKICVFLIAIFMLGMPVFGQLEGNPENWCRNGAFPSDSEAYAIGRVRTEKGARAYFHRDDDDCPNGPKCRDKRYLINGNKVIVSRTFGKFTCVWYQPVRGSETVGWIKSELIERPADGGYVTDTKSILGEWQFYGNWIKLAATKAKDRLKVTGFAYWKGLGDPHFGELDDIGQVVENGIVKYGAETTGEYDCRVTMRFLPGFMIVSDNMNCGGANVSFSGVYRRKK